MPLSLITRRAVLLLGCTGLVLFASCQKPQLTVTSSDGHATLVLNTAGLPAGVDASDITLSPVIVDDTLMLENERPLALYRLEPDGLELKIPAEVTIDVQTNGGRIPGIYHASANGIESMVAASVYDPHSGVATLRTSVSHFSTLIIKSEDFDVTATAPAYVFVNVPFDVTGSIRKVTDKREVIVAQSGTEWSNTLVRSLGLNAANLKPKEVIGELEIRNPWSAEDKLQALDGSPVTPVLHQAVRQNVNANTHEYTQSFTCTQPGFITIRYNPSIQTPNTSYKNLTPNTVQMSTTEFPHTVLTGEIECFDNIVCGGMRLDEALGIATESCEGRYAATATCNEGTGTWWLDVDIKKEGCSPACVVNLETKTAEMNWRCAGLEGT